MFKKPLSDLKTSAPLRNSDRRRIKQQVVDAYMLPAEDGDTLVPDGLQSAKFSTHLDEPGVIYMSKDGDPLWFTLGRGASELIPTVYTLWKSPRLLPFLSTPAQVIPVLIGGADLMAPGVVQHSPGLEPHRLVSVTQYRAGALGPPLAVGRTALAGDALGAENVKGKAVHVLHTWKDKLWELGKGREAGVPEPEPMAASQPDAQSEGTGDAEAAQPAASATVETPAFEGDAASSVQPEPADEVNEPSKALSPGEVTDILRNALIHAITTSLQKLPPGSFPMPASSFYTSHLLPARSAREVVGGLTPVDIKHSSHKTLSAFLKACERDGLLVLKQGKGDVLVASVATAHTDVMSHRGYRTVQQEAEKQAKAAARENEDAGKADGASREMAVAELYKPHQTSVRLFEALEKDTSALYSAQDVKALLNVHISANNLVNARDQAYVNVAADNVLATVLGAGGSEFMKREELIRRVLEKMQAWHEIRIEGKDPLLKKGALRPIAVQIKIRQGRKACTLVTGFEPFQLAADDLADVLRLTCASSTTVAPLQGKNAGLEVMVQGKQMGPVTQLLMARGVPKRYIEFEDMSDKKKK